MKTYQGDLSAANKRFAIVLARFNSFVTEKLLDGALDMLKRHGVNEDAVEVAWVPGCMEIPVAAKKLADTGRFQAVIALGAVIRGDTPHWGYVAGECAKGIAKIGLDTGIPCIFGVITADNVEQAIERAGIKAGNKGADAAVAALEMADLLTKIQ